MTPALALVVRARPAAELDLAFAVGFAAAVGLALWVVVLRRLLGRGRSAGPGASGG